MSAGQVSLKGKREARYRIVARFHSECELWRKGRVSGAEVSFTESLGPYSLFRGELKGLEPSSSCSQSRGR